VKDPLVEFADQLPQGSIAETFIGVLGYLDPSGNMAYATFHAGNATLSTFVGLLELGKLKVVEHFERGWEGHGDAG
jgi:hypothetical protein